MKPKESKKKTANEQATGEQNLNESIVNEQITSEQVVVEQTANEQDVSEQEKAENESKNVVKVLSPQAKKWQEYLNKIGVTPEMYLRRYPDHRYQEFIKELCDLPKKT
jgi:deoxyribodipyrimidine photolyase